MIGRAFAAALSLFLLTDFIGYPGQNNPAPVSASCPFGSALADGCPGAQAHGTIVDAHLADAKAVVALNILGGTGYTSGGPYTWTSSGGGCSVNASGTVTVTGGVIGNANYTISNHGSGCTSRPTISIPAGAAGGSGGSIIPTVYQVTPHNAATTWNVAGIDYPVGLDTTLTLADPTAGGLPSGCSFAGHTVTCGGSGGTLNSWNFGLHSTRLVLSANGWTVTNNEFTCTHGTTTDLDQVHVNSGVTSATIKYNTFNGGSVLGTGCVSGGMTSDIQSVQTSGTIVIEYNYCTFADSKCVNFGSSGSTTLTITEKYNWWGELGTCGGGCSHGEAEYSFGATTQTLTWALQFNVGINHFQNSPTNLTSELAQVGDQMIVATDSEYNLILAMGPWAYTGSDNSGQAGPFVASASLFCGHQEGGAASGTIAHNLFDYSGAFFPYNGSGSTCAGDFTFTSNLNAGTGNTCTTSTCN